MAVTTALASEIITRARYLLKDTSSSNYRWTDAEFLLWLADGQRLMVQKQPRYYIDSGVQHSGTAVPDPGAVSATSSSLKVHPFMNDAMVNYACYRAMMKDGGEGSVQLAQAYLAQFYHAVFGVAK